MPRRLPADLEDALASNRAARDRFWAMPSDQKDAWVGWVDRARMPRARRRRIAEAVRRLSGSGGRRETTMTAEPVVAVPRQDWLVWVIGIALLAALAAFLLWFTVYRHHHSSSRPSTVVVASKTNVPKVTGIRFQSAQFQLRQAKLVPKLVRRHARKPRGVVVGQAPKHGASVAQGTTVTLAVSSGPPGVALADLSGLAAADAVRYLTARGLKPKLEQVASTQPPGTVLSQSPKAGTRARRGTQVVLQVAKGNPAVAVPSVTGQPAQAAATTLEHAGLKSTLATVPSSQPKGTVIAQHPSAGARIAHGSTVRLNVSRGPSTTTTTTAATTTVRTTTTAATTTQPTTTAAAPSPTGNDYVGMRLSQAAQKIAQGRQQVIVQYIASSKPAGTVVANSTAGSRERLQVSAGAQPNAATSVPDVTGEDAATARGDLQSAGFTAIAVQWPVSDPSSDGTVVYETPAGGHQSPDGNAIVIYIGAAGG